MITIYLDSEDGNIFALMGYARRWCKQRDGNLDRYRELEQQLWDASNYGAAIQILKDEFEGLVVFEDGRD